MAEITLSQLSLLIPANVDFKLTQEGFFNIDSEHGKPWQSYESLKLSNLILGDKIEAELLHTSGWGIGYIGMSEFAPILYPLEMITQVIFIEGDNGNQPFCPLNRLRTEGILPDEIHFVDGEFKLYGKFDLDWTELPFNVIHTLLSWHINAIGISTDNFIDKSKV